MSDAATGKFVYARGIRKAEGKFFIAAEAPPDMRRKKRGRLKDRKECQRRNEAPPTDKRSAGLRNKPELLVRRRYGGECRAVETKAECGKVSVIRREIDGPHGAGDGRQAGNTSQHHRRLSVRRERDGACPDGIAVTVIGNRGYRGVRGTEVDDGDARDVIRVVKQQSADRRRGSR